MYLGNAKDKGLKLLAHERMLQREIGGYDGSRRRCSGKRPSSAVSCVEPTGVDARPVRAQDFCSIPVRRLS